MKVLIVSDTHGRNHHLLKTIERVSPIDLMIHLGDYEGGEEYIRSIATYPIELVSGNNDFFNGLPKEKMIQIGKYKVMITHGHRYGVNSDITSIKEAAKRNQADIVMFGHTHVPLIDLSGDVWAINPGSLSLPRQSDKIPTFIIMDIDTFGNAHFTLNKL
ncbi:metallophosphoesterase [Mobilitalea sibirica]|uniref:Phosphoesterase n=1 Tax=Mobilitalea sibirica TaxID=1462919 RepID=A0A8J7L2F4_9FIRM|nr:metallophosphoesterase [Mobilitalea sibirica]MBH1940493.1 metallophosphoesterase [Mobilitalea sibirica]